MTDSTAKEISQAIRELSRGDVTTPLGMEAVVMALGGPGTPGHDSVVSGLHDISDALREVARAISDGLK